MCAFLYVCLCLRLFVFNVRRYVLCMYIVMSRATCVDTTEKCMYICPRQQPLSFIITFFCRIVCLCVVVIVVVSLGYHLGVDLRLEKVLGVWAISLHPFSLCLLQVSAAMSHDKNTSTDRRPSSLSQNSHVFCVK